MTLVLQRYGDRSNFMTLFNPSAQIVAANHEDRAYFGHAPILLDLKNAYGDNFPVMWLLPQILDLVVYSNSKGTLNESQARTLAEIIAKEYYYLKASEVLLFFFKFKAGEYGHFYGVVDPMRITGALAEFCKERKTILEKKEQEDARKAEEPAPDAINPEEWCRQIGFPECHSIIEVIRIREDIIRRIDAIVWFILLLKDFFTNKRIYPHIINKSM